MTKVTHSGARDLTSKEIEVVAGGRLNWSEGASIVIGLSMFSPITMCFGFPIAGGMLVVNHYISDK